MQQIRLSTPKQILDAVPRLLGYSPVGSLVAIPLSGKRGGVVLRFDLPEVPEPSSAGAAPYANAVIGHLSHLRSIERVVFVLCPDLPFGSGPRPPFSVVAEELVAAADRAGIEVAACICRAADAWGVYGCDDVDCCDIGPRALGSQEEWVQATAKPGDESLITPASVTRRLRFAEEDERHWQHHDGEDDLPSMRQRWLAAFAPDTFRAAPADAELAHLLCTLRGRHTSELLLVTIGFGAHSDLLSLAPVWSTVMGEEDVHRPLPEFSRRRVRQAAAILRRLAELVDLDDEPVLLASMSWLEWASGRSSAAAAFAKRALGVSADDPLASSVAWLVERCVVPPWLAVVEQWSDEPEAAAAGRDD
ncbi:hypothetical protein HDC34_001688 [Pseudoclavibacter sp. JAI123]|uniref:DUF4192 family protein n=1 Tax=Pseudoclavibacter sp. JAI123 TaxID=2723065 RepID=UPI0015C88725|nr:DUF4192 family protein [Pseudoclavibacter sp. JAI123]NYF13394.1 hypothetical protein [Pseudoclavibacter sp. JAI123]